MPAITQQMPIGQTREAGPRQATLPRLDQPPIAVTANNSAEQAPEPLVDTTRAATLAPKPIVDEAACSLAAGTEEAAEPPVAEVAGDNHDHQLLTFDT
jgi:hypothetical protein